MIKKHSYYFELDNGNISAWIDGDSIQIKCIDRNFSDPVDLSSEQVKEFAKKLMDLVGIVEELK